MKTFEYYCTKCFAVTTRRANSPKKPQLCETTIQEAVTEGEGEAATKKLVTKRCGVALTYAGVLEGVGLSRKRYNQLAALARAK